MQNDTRKPDDVAEAKGQGTLAAATGSAATYWHEIPQAEQEKIIKESGLTVAQFLEKYKQPDWCEYPEALAGQMGCWPLILSHSIHCKADCGDCDCIAKPPNESSSAMSGGRSATNETKP